MNRHSFDEQLRRRAAAESMSLHAQTEERFIDAMEMARTQPAEAKAKNRWKMRALLAAECALAIAAVLFFWPRQDVTDQSAANQPSQAEISATMIPVTQPQHAKAPEVTFAVDEGQTITLNTHVQNDTADIWLVEWQAEMKDDQLPARQLLWMEPGTECAYRAWWPADEKIELRMSYRGYRVTAKVLHWLDGEWLNPDEEGYAEQQSLIEAAFEAEALILAPGIWINGKAGPMRLVLPSSYQEEHPDITALSYYVEKGMLEDAYLMCGGEQAFVMEARTWAEEP